MSDELELDVIAEEITYLKEQENLSPSDVNKLMILVGNLTGLLRVYTDDDHVMAFVVKVDDLVLSGHFTLVTVFYIIPVAIEMLSKIYSMGSLKRPRKRYHKKKKKVKELTSVVDNEIVKEDTQVDKDEELTQE